MDEGAIVRGVGLGLALASVLILLFGQPWDPKAIRDRWKTGYGFSPQPIVGEAYAWLNARAASIVLIVGLATQVLGTALGGSSAAGAWGWSLSLMLVVAVAAAVAWARSRESLVTRRLVALSLDANMPDVTDIQFLWRLDQARTLPLVTAPPGLVLQDGAGAPTGPVAQHQLRETAYGRHRAFERISIVRKTDPLATSW